MTVPSWTAPPFEHALVVGAGGGIGAALVRAIGESGASARVTGWSRNPPAGGSLDAWSSVDITDEASISAASSTLGAVDLVVVATGLLHRPAPPGGTAVVPEKSMRSLSMSAMAEAFAVNTIGPALVFKHVLPHVPRDSRAVLSALSARVGSISDNRLGGWYAYRASKAALNQTIRTLSIELRRTHPEAVCVGLHPGTVATRLSAPFRSSVDHARLFSPEAAASKLLRVIERLAPGDSGGVIDWSGARVPD